MFVDFWGKIKVNRVDNDAFQEWFLVLSRCRFNAGERFGLGAVEEGISRGMSFNWSRRSHN